MYTTNDNGLAASSDAIKVIKARDWVWFKNCRQRVQILYELTHEEVKDRLSKKNYTLPAYTMFWRKSTHKFYSYDMLMDWAANEWDGARDLEGFLLRKSTSDGDTFEKLEHNDLLDLGGLIDNMLLKFVEKEFTKIKKDDTIMLMSRINPIDEKLVLKTPIFDVVKHTYPGVTFDPVGIKSPDWVTIMVIKTENGERKLLRERQFRYGRGATIEEFPCGMVEKDETPVHAATRELQEECGITVAESDMKHLGSMCPNPAFMSNLMHYFIVDLDKCKYEVGDTHFDEHENIESFWRNAVDVWNMFGQDPEESSIGGAAMVFFCKDQMKVSFDK